MHRFFSPVILILFLFCTCVQIAEAQWHERVTQAPNQFHFAGKRASMTFTESIPGEEMMLTYRRESREPRHFQGDEIRIEQTELGRLATVTLWNVPDLKVITFSLLIPTINLDGSDPLMFQTKSLVTTQHTTIAGPDLVQGPLQSYLTGNLLAQASLVETPDSLGPGVFGKVRISPTCPGPQRPGQLCVGPLPDTDVELHDEDNQIVETTTTDEKGLFAIRSEPGNYTIHIVTSGIFPHCPETPVEISDGLLSVTVDCDTGIR